MPLILRTILLLLAFAAGLLTGCASLAPTTNVAPAPDAVSGLPEPYYRQAQASGATVLQVDPARSLLTIEVRRAGALAGLGHDHVVASHEVRGYVAPERGRADLAIALERLVVDEPALRAQAGFNTQPSADAIEGTRRNMLDKVLEAQRFPMALIRVERIAGRESMRVGITLHGVAREFEVPVRIEAMPGGAMLVSGKLDFKQSDFGMVPYSLLGGALAVQDRLDLRFRIHAGP